MEDKSKTPVDWQAKFMEAVTIMADCRFIVETMPNKDTMPIDQYTVLAQIATKVDKYFRDNNILIRNGRKIN